MGTGRISFRHGAVARGPAVPAPPTGWCSWYCFGPRVTARQVLDNLDAIAKNIPGLNVMDPDGEILSKAAQQGQAAVATIGLNRRYVHPRLGDMRRRSRRCAWM